MNRTVCPESTGSRKYGSRLALHLGTCLIQYLPEKTIKRYLWPSVFQETLLVVPMITNIWKTLEKTMTINYNNSRWYFNAAGPLLFLPSCSDVGEHGVWFTGLRPLESWLHFPKQSTTVLIIWGKFLRSSSIKTVVYCFTSWHFLKFFDHRTLFWWAI